jgi:hypothetical protein
LPFFVEAKSPQDSPDISIAPPPLQVAVTIGDTVTRVTAFRGAEERHEIIYDPSSGAGGAVVELRCPVPATVSWRCSDGNPGQLHWTETQPVPQLFLKDLAGAVRRGHSCIFSIDAGPFGIVSLGVTPRRSAADTGQHGSEMYLAAGVRYVAQRLRVLGGEEERRLGLPADIARQLRSGRYGPIAVAALARGVAAPLLPHLRAVFPMNRRPNSTDPPKIRSGERGPQEPVPRGGRR